MASLPTSAGIVSFAEYEADLRSHELRRNGSRVRLPDQAFLVLALLIERPGELVTREEIQKRLWPSDTFVDFDHGLNNAVNRLREALGDSAEAPKFIETLPRRGYRFKHAVDVGLIAEVPSRSGSESQIGSEIKPASARPAKRRNGSRILLWAAAVTLIALVLGMALLRHPSPLPLSRLLVLPPQNATFNLIGDDGGSVAISRDGTKLAFVAVDSKGVSRIWVRQLAKLNALPIENSEGATFPFWSPGGDWIAFFAQGKLKKVRMVGGPAITLCDAPIGRGGSWNSFATIIFAPDSHSAIYKVNDSGGTAVPVTKVDTSIHTTHRWPRFLPDGRHFLYFAASHFGNNELQDAVYWASIDGSENKRVTTSEADASYTSGFLFFHSQHALVLQTFDPETGELRGQPRPTGETVLRDGFTSKAIFDASESGILAYQVGDWVAGTQLRWFDRSGRQLGTVGEPAFQFALRLSDDGRKLTTGMGPSGVGYSNIWVYDLVRGGRQQITFDKYDKTDPIWSRDGSRILFAYKREHYAIYETALSEAQPESLIVDPGVDAWPCDLSPDGRYLIYGQGLNIGRAKSQLWVYSMERGGKGNRRYRLLSGDVTESGAQISPDGRWVAYSSNRSGRDEVYITRFHTDGLAPNPLETLQVSPSGGHWPRWRRDGKELFYLSSDNTLTTVPITAVRSTLRLGVIHSLFHTNPGFYDFPYDVAPDGSRFIVNVAPQEREAPITVVENWQSDFNH